MSLLHADGTVALQHGDLQVQLTLHAGEVVGLIGPNGVGKTATLRTLLGLHRLRSGRIEIGQRVVDDGRRARSVHARGLGWAPQAPALLPRRPVYRQLAPFVDPSAPLGRRRLDDLLTTLGLAEAVDRRPSHLSGGQTQRLSVLRALVASRCALLDEPTSAQDTDGAAAVRRLVREHARAGGTALVVAHRPEDAYLFADRLVVLEQGRVVQAGSPAQLAAAPSTPYVAHVVGATVLHGTAGRDHVVQGAWGQLHVADDVAPGEVVVVVRPGTVALHRKAPAGSSRNVLRGVVAAIEERAGGVTVRVETNPSLVAALTHAGAAALELRVGDTVWATVKANDIAVTPVPTAVT